MRPFHRSLPILSAVAVLTTVSTPVALAKAAESEPLTHQAASAYLLAAPVRVPATAATARPVTPVVRQYAVPGVSRLGVRALGGGDRGPIGRHYVALSAPRPATGLAVTGATWHGLIPAGLELSVRTRTDGEWSRWTGLVVDEEHLPDADSPEARAGVPGTDPFVVGNVDQVQLRAVNATGQVPRHLELAIIDSGTSARQRFVPAATPSMPATTGLAETAPETAPENRITAPSLQSAPMPTIHSRAQWGADESLRDCCVEYGTIHAGFVHHTVNANDYTKAEVPAVIRGIYAYHTQSRGWRDIGYNFLIDRFGGIWEGRYGGVTKAVVGAHTLNYNQYSFAASAIGNFDTVPPSKAMVHSFASLFAWKLGLANVDPTSRQVVGSTTFDAISGHRDAAATACPGQYLYAKIPQIIKAAAGASGPASGPAPADNAVFTHSFVSSWRPDVLLVAKSSGQVSVARGVRGPGFSSPRERALVWRGTDRVLLVGDWNGDGTVDAMARNRATGTLWLYPGGAKGGFGERSQGWQGWGDRTLLTAVGDMTRDGNPDLMARAPNGHVYLYPGRRDGGFKAPVMMAARLRKGSVAVAVGRWNRDANPDVLIKTPDGRMVLRLGDGQGALRAPVEVGSGFSRYTTVLGIGDMTGDGRPDLLGRTRAGEVYLIRGLALSTEYPQGGFGRRKHVASGWGSYLMG